MKEITCPFCGSSNDEDAEFCRVCKVDFRQLPKEIMPSENPKPKESSGSENDSKEIPNWLADIISRNRKTQGKMAFDSFADALMGINSAADSGDSIQSDSSGLEKIKESMNGEKKLIQNLSDQKTDHRNQNDSSYSFNSLNGKGIQETKADDDSASELEPGEKEEHQLEIQEVLSPQDELLEDEESYRDFSVSRPAQKWDLVPSVESDSAHPTNAASDESLRSETVSEGKIDVADSDVDQLTVSGNKQIDEDEKDAPSGLLTENDAPPPVIISKSEESDITEREDLLPAAYEENLGSSDENPMRNQTSDEVPQLNFDHFPEDTKLQQENPQDSSQSITTPDPAAIETGDPSKKTETFVDSTDQLLVNDQTHEGAAMDNPDEQNLVSEFLSQINSDVPAIEPEMIQKQQDASEVIKSEESENDAVDLNEIILESQQSGEDLTIQSETDAEISDIDAREESFKSVMFENTTEEDSPVPEAKGNPEKVEETDAIPWNLFESVDSFFHENRKEKIYSSFSKEKIPSDFQDRNYQHRMITAVLYKLFQTENQNQSLKKVATRKTNKIIQLVFTLLIFFGVITILVSGVTDFIDLNLVSENQIPSLSTFNYQVESLQEGDNTLLVIDFTPGYINELYAPTVKLIKNLADRKVNIRLATISPSSEMISQKIVLETPQISIENLGFFSGQITAIQSLISLNSDEVKAIFLISSNFQTLKTWIEQINTESVRSSLNILASAQMNSLLTPYYDAGLVESSLSGMIEKNSFSRDDFSDKNMNREIFSVWFIILAAILIYLTGCIDFSMTQSTDKDRDQTAVIRSIESENNNDSAGLAESVTQKNHRRNEARK